MLSRFVFALCLLLLLLYFLILCDIRHARSILRSFLTRISPTLCYACRQRPLETLRPTWPSDRLLNPLPNLRLYPFRILRNPLLEFAALSPLYPFLVIITT